MKLCSAAMSLTAKAWRHGYLSDLRRRHNVKEMSRDAKTESPGHALRFAISSSRDKEYLSLARKRSRAKKLWRRVHLKVGIVNNALEDNAMENDAVRDGGEIILKGLYSGLAGNLAGVIPASAIFIGVYEPTKQKLLKIFPENFSAIAHLVIKQRIQTGQFVSAPDAVRLIVAKEGFRGLYAGYGSFLLRDLPFDAIQFCIYEQLRIGYKLAAKRDLNDPENAIIGAFAGAITGAMTTPLDVIKTRLMIQGSAKQYNGIFHCVNTILKEEGSSAFLRGMGPRVLWIGIGGSIFFGVLEKSKQLLAQRRPLKEN
ncbi:hypothetical protein DH2020_004180 [Rehmannia glutinosa]|uniref:Uncharacterized protein n=1 Tax=Rehmannia glutinosa TaxID=99300 RepID=A0ABR0XNT4_REHGL